MSDEREGRELWVLGRSAVGQVGSPAEVSSTHKMQVASVCFYLVCLLTLTFSSISLGSGFVLPTTRGRVVISRYVPQEGLILVVTR